MADIDIAIDMGTSFTSVYKKGAGLVLREPTVAAIKNSGSGESFYGSEAKKLIGKTTENISIFFPVFEGMIVNFDSAVQLLKYFISKVIEKTFFKPRCKLLMTVPCGLPPEEKQKYEKAAVKAGFRNVNIADAPMAAALGLNEHIDYSTPLLLADIGGGTTDIAAVTLSGIISGCSLGIGGNNVDTGIIDFILDEYGIKIGLLTAEKIKVQIGSLYINDNTSMMINGRAADTGNPVSMLLTSKNINTIIEYYYGRILDVAEAAINSLPSEVSAEIREKGLFLCGGGSSMLGIDNYFYKRLRIPVKVTEEPSYACILGAGKILADKALFEKLTGLE